MTAILDASSEVSIPDGRYPMLPAGIIGIAVHHSVTHMPADATEEAERGHIRLIDAYHVSQGFGGFGYHMAVFPSGRVYQTCRTLLAARAHVASRNAELLGICAIGDFSVATLSDPQLIGLMTGIFSMETQLGDALKQAPNIAIRGHKDWATPQSPTACPGTLDSVDSWFNRGLILTGNAGPNDPPPNKDYGVFQVGKQLYVIVGGVNVLQIGSPDGALPGQIAKLVGDRWFWLGGAADAYVTGTKSAAYWSVIPVD